MNAPVLTNSRTHHCPKAAPFAPDLRTPHRLHPPTHPEKRSSAPSPCDSPAFLRQFATLGPASRTFEQLEALFLAGVDVFRLNFSHGFHEEKAEVRLFTVVNASNGSRIGDIAHAHCTSSGCGKGEAHWSMGSPEKATPQCYLNYHGTNGRVPADSQW